MSTRSPFLYGLLASPRTGPVAEVCRLGLATRGDTGLTPDDIRHAIDQGINFLNWCGTPDALSRAVAGLGRRRSEVVVCVQFEARSSGEAHAEFDTILRELNTDYVDVLTLYYVEEPQEWEQIRGSGGALAFCNAAQREGRVRMIGVTSHQRRLAADMARSGLLDLLMIRYNAAHRGAETEVFPVTTSLGLPCVVYTCLRWGALLQATPDDPPDFSVPKALTWYRFALQAPAVTAALMAPANRAELDEDLAVLAAPGPLLPEEYEQLAAHGGRVRLHGGSFP